MESRNEVLDNLEFHPLAPDRWSHFEALFGEKGACGGCWCMWWRLKRSEKESSKKRILSIIESYPLDGVILGCTELPLLIEQKDTSIPLLNTSEIHVEAALEYALS